MKIALTHNLQVAQTEEQAEFDTPATISTITRALNELGHEVHAVEVSGSVSGLVARLELLQPDLVFNTAEGRTGRTREAFYPGLFERMGLPYTCSDAFTCTLTLDKHRTKQAVAELGIPTPRGRFVEAVEELDGLGLLYPLIIKPNFEGSSKGITLASVVEDAAALAQRVAALLAQYPDGVLVEEYIEGQDIVVPFVEAAETEHGGVLPPFGYTFAPEVEARDWRLYDFGLKNLDSDAVKLQVPADLTDATALQLMRWSRRIYEKLGVRDMGRIDWRVDMSGRPYFLEVNALPSLDPGAGIYAAAAQVGLSTPGALIQRLLVSSAARFGITQHDDPHRLRAQSGKLRVGLVYNIKRVAPKATGEDDAEAEFDSPKTINAIRDAIQSFGHEVVLVEATGASLGRLSGADVDVVFNIAEGLHGRARESAVPAYLELLDIPYTGSDPTTLALALDKALAKRIVAQSGVPTPRFVVMYTGSEPLPEGMLFPVVVKPNAEGSSKGVFDKSVAHSEDELRQMAARILERYRQQGVIVEEFLSGREFTVGLLGERDPRVLSPMEIVFTANAGEFPVYTFAHKLDYGDQVRYDAPAVLDPELQAKIEAVAYDAFVALGCRDVARVDVRLNGAGEPNFIECNPLPGLSPGWSDLCLIAQSVGMDYATLIGEILAPAVRRFRARYLGEEVAG
jgi:D-alanine-D-alanine ligase